MRRGMRVPTILMGLLFLVAVALQYNDPDPVQWMAIYGAAALVCLLALRGRLPRWLPALVGLAALVWAAALAPRVVGQVAPGELFREMGGLLIVAIWMLVLLAAAPRQAGRA